MRSNKGQIGILFVGIALFLLLIIGVILVFGSMVIDWVSDEATPILSDLGVVGSANLTEIAGYTITPANSVIQSFTWMTGVIFVLGIIACIGLSFVFRGTGNKWAIGLFVGFMILLVIASIFVSNIYEDFYNDVNDVGTRLKEHTLMSWFLLYSPVIMCIIGFICGIILFTGDDTGGGYYGT